MPIDPRLRPAPAKMPAIQNCGIAEQRGNWRTTYTDYRGSPQLQPLRPERAFADVGVSLHKTRREALVALGEPAFGPIRSFPNGVRVRALVWSPSVHGDASRQVGGVASVVGNVFISSQGQGRPPIEGMRPSARRCESTAASMPPFSVGLRQAGNPGGTQCCGDHIDCQRDAGRHCGPAHDAHRDVRSLRRIGGEANFAGAVRGPRRGASGA